MLFDCRSIVVHAGGRQGFIQGADLIFTSKTNSGDYHGEMNEANFMKWFEEQLLPSLEEPSLIVMDNASYHSALVEKTPTTSTRKQDMQQWLRDHNIPFDETMVKPQLLGLINRYVQSCHNSTSMLAIQGVTKLMVKNETTYSWSQNKGTSSHIFFSYGP